MTCVYIYIYIYINLIILYYIGDKSIGVSDSKVVGHYFKFDFFLVKIIWKKNEWLLTNIPILMQCLNES